MRTTSCLKYFRGKNLCYGLKGEGKDAGGKVIINIQGGRYCILVNSIQYMVHLAKSFLIHFKAFKFFFAQ